MLNEKVVNDKRFTQELDNHMCLIMQNCTPNLQKICIWIIQRKANLINFETFVVLLPDKLTAVDIAVIAQDLRRQGKLLEAFQLQYQQNLDMKKCKEANLKTPKEEDIPSL